MWYNTMISEVRQLNVQYSHRRRLNLTEENATACDQCEREWMLTKSTFAEHPRWILYPSRFSLPFPLRIMDSDFWEPKTVPWIENPE